MSQEREVQLAVPQYMGALDSRETEEEKLQCGTGLWHNAPRGGAVPQEHAPLDYVTCHSVLS